MIPVLTIWRRAVLLPARLIVARRAASSLLYKDSRHRNISGNIGEQQRVALCVGELSSTSSIESFLARSSIPYLVTGRRENLLRRRAVTSAVAQEARLFRITMYSEVGEGTRTLEAAWASP